MTRLALASLATLMLASHVHADVRIEVGPDGKNVQLTTTFGGKASAQLMIAGGKATTVHAGSAIGTLVAGHEKVVVALVTEAREPFQISVIDGGVRGKPITVARPGQRRDLPFAVVGTVTPKGFAVFFQEVQADDPSNAHTYLLELDERGEPSGAAKEIAVPWALAAAAHNGKGYHLALIYPGDANGMRLSMVSLSAAGGPEQHPDWSSPAGFISDVHLVAADGKIRAFYRGGRGGNRLFESDVTQIRSWGSEPPAAVDHGALAERQAIATSGGKPLKVDARR